MLQHGAVAHVAAAATFAKMSLFGREVAIKLVRQRGISVMLIGVRANRHPTVHSTLQHPIQYVLARVGEGKLVGPNPHLFTNLKEGVPATSADDICQLVRVTPHMAQLRMWLSPLKGRARSEFMVSDGEHFAAL